MTIGKNILKAKYINFPQHYKELPLKDLTYKWDNVPVEELEVTVEGMHEHFVNDAKNAEVLGEKKLDPVGKADADIDNDGDVDKSDKFLHARRKKVTKIIAAKNRSSKK